MNAASSIFPVFAGNYAARIVSYHTVYGKGLDHMTANKIDYKKISDLKAFFIHYKNHMGLFLLDMVCALSVAGIDLLFPYGSKRCMERYSKSYAGTSYLRFSVPKIMKYVKKANANGLKRFLAFEKKIRSKRKG